MLAFGTFVEDCRAFVCGSSLDRPEVHGVIGAFRAFLLKGRLVGFGMFLFVVFILDACGFLLRRLVLFKPLLFVSEIDARDNGRALVVESGAYEIAFRAIHLVRKQRHLDHVTALRAEFTSGVQVSNLDFHCV